jgi:hypothetical protein
LPASARIRRSRMHRIPCIGVAIDRVVDDTADD